MKKEILNGSLFLVVTICRSPPVKLFSLANGRSFIKIGLRTETSSQALHVKITIYDKDDMLIIITIY